MVWVQRAPRTSARTTCTWLNRDIFHSVEERSPIGFCKTYRLCSASCEPRRCRGGTMKSVDVVTFTAAILVSSCFAVGQVGKTEITKWQDGKNGALSLTYDD